MTVSEALPLALEFLGDSLPPEFRWKAGTSCKGAIATSCLYFNCPECDAPNIDWTRLDYRSFTVAPHNVPCPPLSDALAMAMLRATGVPIQPYDLDAVTAKPVTWMSWVKDQFFYTEDPAEAIVLAVAALAVNASSKTPRIC